MPKATIVKMAGRAGGGGSGDEGREVVELLLDFKADIDYQDKQGTTALMWACMRSNVAVAKLLLERGANKDLRDKDGDSAASYYAAPGARKDDLLALLPS